MKVLIDKSFEKDIVKINDKKLLNSIADCIENIKSIKKLDQITDCKKLTGYKNSYIIKIGSYRVGFIFENQTVEFIRFLHRSRIYKYFP